MSLNLASELVFSAREKGGGTFDLIGEEFPGTFGYAVGGKVPSLVLGLRGSTIGTVEAIADWIDKNKSDYYGSWADGDDLHIDAVTITADRDYAIVLGKHRGELAIWDFAAGEEIRL